MMANVFGGKSDPFTTSAMATGSFDSITKWRESFRQGRLLRWLPYDLCVGRCLAQWRKPIFKSFDIRGPQGVEDPARRTKLMSGTALTALGSLYYDEPTSLVGLSFPGTRHPTTNPFRNNMQHTTSNSHKLPFI